MATGEDAVRAAAEERPDLVLMDIRLAGEMDGIEAARQIAAASPAKIAFMTGYSDERIVQRARALNPAAYLVKPVTSEHIHPVIAAIFGEQDEPRKPSHAPGGEEAR